ncbi:DUF6735 family protein [Haloarchaeobius sp. HRN-SO-5]|uniref:DUF6735 family protein n=1 Tax=Haloarchaeobius sp. HRN-SO-5 TaxID=3446118 RepID=UPI003EBC4E49
MTVGHRALVAYERTDGSYSLHHSQWGALGYVLLDELDSDHPFGAGEDWERRAHETILDGSDPAVPEAHDARVDPRPRGSADSLDALPGRFDFLEYEALFVVSTTVLVTAYQPLWFARALDDAAPSGDGALVSIRRGSDPVADAARVTAWFRGVADTVRAMHDSGTLSAESAREHLRSRVLEWEAERRTVLVGD